MTDPFAQSGLECGNSLPHALRAGTLAGTDAIPGTVTAEIRSFLLATHFGGPSHDLTSLPSSTV